MNFRRITALLLFSLLFIQVFSQKPDRRIRAAIEASCDCFENANEYEKRNLEELAGNCILEGMLEDMDGFSSYFDININTASTADFEALGAEYGLILSGHCPAFAVLALDYYVESDEYENDLNEGLGSITYDEDSESLFLGDGSYWRFEGVEGTDLLLNDLCYCMERERGSMVDLETDIQACFLEILPDHMQTWMSCIDSEVYADEKKMFIASHDLGVTIGMALAVDCDYMNQYIWDVDEISGTITIPMTRNGSTFTIPVILNDALKIDMLFDSGAADCSLSSDVFRTLVRTGTIKEHDVLGEQTYILADGSEVVETQVNLSSIEIGGQVLTNVRASVSKSLDAPLLLGQSVMLKFGTITMDYNNNQVILSK
jgi:aspartyl protease family protein